MKASKIIKAHREEELRQVFEARRYAAGGPAAAKRSGLYAQRIKTLNADLRRLGRK